MKVFLVTILVVVIGLFVWQAILLIRDLIKRIKTRKIKKAVDNSNDKNKSAEENSARKE